jgi:hypothetical protein
MSLNNIVRGVKSTYKKPETSLYHHGMMKLLVVHELRKQDSSWKKFLTKNYAQEISKSVEGSVTGEHSKGSDRKKGDRINKGQKYSNKIDLVGPSSPKYVSKFEKGKIIVLEEHPAPMVE